MGKIIFRCLASQRWQKTKTIGNLLCLRKPIQQSKIEAKKDTSFLAEIVSLINLSSTAHLTNIASSSHVFNTCCINSHFNSHSPLRTDLHTMSLSNLFHTTQPPNTLLPYVPTQYIRHLPPFTSLFLQFSELIHALTISSFYTVTSSPSHLSNGSNHVSFPLQDTYFFSF